MLWAIGRTGLAGVPLRLRLVAAVLVLAAVALAVSAVVATSVLRGYLVDRLDDDLRSGATATGPPGAADCLGLQGRPAFPRGGPRPDPLVRFYTVYTLPSGAACTVGAPDESPPPDLPPVAGSRQPFTVDAVSGDGQWRVLVSASQGRATITLASPLDGVGQTTRRLLLIQGLVGLAVLAGLAGAAYAVVRSSLRPLLEVERTAAAIAADHAVRPAGGDLAGRVPRQDDRTEVGRLATAFNSMLGSIEGSFAAQRASEGRLRRFVADASHELRTPLTSIRGFAELYRQGAVAPGPDLDRVMGRVEGEATRMGRLVEELLLLARLDQHRPLEAAPVDLAALVEDAVHDARLLDGARRVTLGTTPAVVRGDAARLQQLLVNLLGNALAHTPAGSPVEVRLGTADGRVLLEVQDHGPGLTEEQARHVFERFYRVDPARSRTAGVPGLSGSGLGLSIVAAVAEAHGGRADVRSTVGEGATFLLDLPLA